MPCQELQTFFSGLQGGMNCSPELSFQVAVSIQAEDGSEPSLRSSGSSELGEGPCPLRATALARVARDDTPATSQVTIPFF